MFYYEKNILISAFVLPLIFASQAKADTVYQCGSNPNCKATLKDDGTLIFSGSGVAHAPFGKGTYGSSVKKIIVEDGIDSIGGQGFACFPNLESIQPSDSVKTIGFDAFSYNGKLKNIDLGQGVEIIERSAFADCKSLTSITIPDSVKKLEDCLFQGTELTPENIKMNFDDSYIVANGVFGGMKNLTSFTIPEGTESIGEFAFVRTGLTEIVIPDSVKSIGYNAFEGLELTSIKIPDSVTSIGFGAFWGTNITELEIPDGISDIADALYGMNNLQTLTVSDNTKWEMSLMSDDFGFIAELISREDERDKRMAEEELERMINNGIPLFNSFPPTIKCKGELKKCQENIMFGELSEDLLNFLTEHGITLPNLPAFEAVPYEVKNPDGTTSMYFNSKPVSDGITVEKADGSVYQYDKEGKLIAITGKRIYTVEEATALVRPKGKNTFSIRYR